MSGRDPISATHCSVCGTQHVSHGCPAAVGVRVGAVLEGKYELVRLIGHGGMGEVYEGRHRVIGRRVAVKFLHGEYARNADVARRFENEARAAGGSEHENIAGVYDVGVLPDDTRYLVMEFLEGEDVDKLVRREGALPIPRAAYIVIQACRALDAVHQRGIVHRDLKPSNLFLAKRADKTDLVKVIDFGIAKLKTSDGDGGTKTGKAIGTAHYMSPEQARGERAVDTRSDVYSLGVILYELLSGRKPHDGDSLLQVLHKVMTQAPVPLEAVRPGLPDALYEVVRRAMSPLVADRYATVAELGDAILPFAGRAVPPIRSQPAAFAAPNAEAGETRPSAPSALDVPAPIVGPSVVGIVRSEPRASEAALRARSSRSPMTRVLVAGGIMGLLGMVVWLAIASVSSLRATSKPLSPAVDPSPALTVARTTPSTPESPPLSPVASLAPTTAAIPRASAPTPSMALVTRSAWVQPSGHRTPSSEHPSEASGVPLPAAPAAAMASTTTAIPTNTAPPPKPPATDRGNDPF